MIHKICGNEINGVKKREQKRKQTILLIEGSYIQDSPL